MALTTCPDCGNEVSSRASSCPRCGAPVGKPSAVHGRGEGCFLQGLNTGCAVVVILFLLTLAIIVVGLGVAGS